MEVLRSSETSGFTRATRLKIPENLKSYMALSGWVLYRRSDVSPVRYELGFYIPEDDILHSHRRETSNLT
jgi:hypothetical protein